MKSLQTKRHFVDSKIIIGIDPSKKKHQSVVLYAKGIPMGNSMLKGFHRDGSPCGEENKVIDDFLYDPKRSLIY